MKNFFFPIVIIDSVAANLCSVFVANQIAELSELESIQDLPLLRALNLLKNPVQVRRK